MNEQTLYQSMTYSFLSLFDIMLLTLSIISYHELPKSHDMISRHFDKIIISYHDISRGKKY